MKCNITINMDNAAFIDYDNELSNILFRLARTLKTIDITNHELNLKDSNGNTVGTCTISKD